MRLTFEQIKSITKGAARVISEDGKIKFLRFTEQQESLYRESGNTDFYKKTFATAGVRLEFETDSKSLYIKTDVSPASSRTYFSHDIYVNGEYRLSVSSDVSYVADKRMTVEGSCALGDGSKRVCIYFPWSMRSELIAIELDNGSTLTPVTHKRKILMFGDSITQGYCAKNSALTYTSRIVDALDAEGCNKGIGGECFFPELAALPENYTPDIITVAYGTNDWAKDSKETFEHNSEQFYANLSALYPSAKIYALTPIWRGDMNRETRVGEFGAVEQQIAQIAEKLSNVTLVRGFDLVPHKHQMFSPDVLHPCDEGFEEYAKNLVNALNID